MATMIKNPYLNNFAALQTYKRILENTDAHELNKVYLNERFGILFFRNTRGYLHVLRPGRRKEWHGQTVFYLTDYVLTRANTLKDCGLVTQYCTSIEELRTVIHEQTGILLPTKVNAMV